MNTFCDGSDRKEANKLIQSHCSSFKFKFLPSMQICCKYKQFFCTIYEETFKSFRKIKMKLKLQ